MSFIASKINNQENHIIKYGQISKLDEIFPTCIDFRNPKHIEIDGKYIASLIIVDYSREMEECFLNRIISLDIDLQISMFYEK